MLLLSLLLLLVSIGCEDDRVAEVVLEAADRQAAQNEKMADVTRETAEATKQIAAVHGDLQAERRELSGGWNDLEAERRQIAQQRRTESALAIAVKGTGVTLVVLLALGVSAAPDHEACRQHTQQHQHGGGSPKGERVVTVKAEIDLERRALGYESDMIARNACESF